MASLDTTNIPASLIIGNKSETDTVLLPLYPDNTIFALGPGEEIVYEVTSSREYLYYYQECRALGLSLEEAENTEDSDGAGG